MVLERRSVHDLDKRHGVGGGGSILFGVFVGHLNGFHRVVLVRARATELTGGGGGGGGSGSNSGGGSVEYALFVALRLVAHQLALGLGAQFGGFAFPGALGFFAQGRAFGFGGGTGGSAYSGSADSFAFGAISRFAHFLGASYRAYRLFAVNFTFGAFARFAVHLTFRSGAHGVALGRADRIVTQPFASGVARASRLSRDNSGEKNTNN